MILQTAKYLAPRLILFICTALVSAFVYKEIYWQPEIRDHAPMLFNLIEYQWHNDVLYVGESSNFWVADEDEDKRIISDMINDSLEGARMSALQISATHAGIYLPVIELIDTNSRVKYLVVTMNLRSFDKPWIYSPLEGALNRSKCFYSSDPELLNRLKVVFGYYHRPDPLEQEKKMLECFEYDTLKTEFPLEYKTIKSWCAAEKFPLPEGGEDYPKRELADHYIKAYAFQIDTQSNPRIKDFDEIVQVCKKKNIKLFFNIMGENTEWADSLVGKELLWLMRQNRDLLVDRYSQKGVVMIDNLERVPGDYFGEKNWTTEHYNQYGRMIVARHVRDSVQKYIVPRRK